MTLNNIDNILKLNFLAAADPAAADPKDFKDLKDLSERRRQKRNLVFPRFFLKIADQIVFEVRNG